MLFRGVRALEESECVWWRGRKPRQPGLMCRCPLFYLLFQAGKQTTPLPPRFFRTRYGGWVFMWDFRQGLSRFFNGLDVEVECVQLRAVWKILDADSCSECGCF